MTACVEGCSIRGQHRTTCETRDAEVDPCTGCLPREAEFGNLCAFAWQRLNSDVIDAAPLVRHLRFLAEPDAGRKPAGDGRSMGDPAWGSILSAAIGAADEVHMTLAGYAHLVLEEHPNGEHMAGPDEHGVWRSQDCWHVVDGASVPKPSTVAGIKGDAEATARLVKWLLPLLPWCSEQEWAGEMRRELSALIATTKARWPMEDTKTRGVAGVLCTSCGRASLVYTPTSGPRLPFHVACTHPQCGRVYTEAEYDGAIGRLAIERGYVA